MIVLKGKKFPFSLTLLSFISVGPIFSHSCRLPLVSHFACFWKFMLKTPLKTNGTRFQTPDQAGGRCEGQDGPDREGDRADRLHD